MLQVRIYLPVIFNLTGDDVVVDADVAGDDDNLASEGSISRSPEHSITDLAFWFAAASSNFSFCLLLVPSFTLLLELGPEAGLSPSSR